MRVLVALALSVAVVALPGCSGPADSPSDVAGSRRLRIGYPGPQGFGELPSFLANQSLEAQGYDIETTFYVQPELAVQALVQGTIDLSVGSTRIYWVAAALDAPVVAVLEGVRRNHVLVARRDIGSCRQLEAQRVGLTGLAAMGATLFREYVQATCPGVFVETLLIAGSPNRAAALLNGTIAATVMFRAEAVELMRRVPDRFHSMMDFEAGWLDLITSAMFANTTFARQHPREVQDYVQALLRANRLLGTNAAVAAAHAARLMGEGEDYGPVAEAYLAAGAWDPEGGLSPAAVRRTEEFLLRIGELKRRLPDRVLVDRSFLDRARAGLAAGAKH